MWTPTGRVRRSSTSICAVPRPCGWISPSDLGRSGAVGRGGKIPAASPSERRWESSLRPLPAIGGGGEVTVLVFGTGLIGTSIALALRASGDEVFLADADEATAKLAADLGAGTVVPDLRDAKGLADVAVLAMPPVAIAPALAFVQEFAVADVFTDVASVKVLPVVQARALGCRLETYVPGHPLAGRERHGPAAAQADLFLGRTWALCPLPETSPDAVEAVTRLVVACGADPVTAAPETHDRWVALISH